MELIHPTRPSRPTGGSQTRRLLLVDPYPRENPYRLTASERRAVWFPKLSLPVIAAYTTEDWQVDLVDEAVQDVNFDHPCDLVGLSIMTCYAPRAYETATEFRKRGNTVVSGGVHPTYCPDEAMRYCDAIVCGEAEDLWPALIADFETGARNRRVLVISSRIRISGVRVHFLMLSNKTPGGGQTHKWTLTPRTVPSGLPD
jgi:hypothetical protein